jgi:hypothetical protein
MQGWPGMRQMIGLFALLVATFPALPAPIAQKSYASPEAAIAALADAVKSGNKAALNLILGSKGGKLISSGDPVADENGRAAFTKAYGEANKLEFEDDAQAVLVIGKDGWPFPIPLVKIHNKWKFDTAQGEQEILARRIGRNELAAIQVCLAVADAEHEYAASHVDSDGVPNYTLRIVSAPNKHDGLYWPATPNETSSPLGPLMAAAAAEGYTPAHSMVQTPYHGYFYRILGAQGKNAPGGEYEYSIRGKMIGGFAVIAYPARYGASGIKTFMVNHEGMVFEKDLGKDTTTVAANMKTYNPDATWKEVEILSKK